MIFIGRDQQRKKKKVIEEKTNRKSPTADSGYFWMMALWVPVSSSFDFSIFCHLSQQTHVALQWGEGATFKTWLALITVWAPSPCALQRAQVWTTVPHLQSLPCRASQQELRAWENTAALRGPLVWCLCPPFSLHLNFPGEGTDCSLNPIFPPSQLSSSAAAEPDTKLNCLAKRACLTTDLNPGGLRECPSKALYWQGPNPLREDDQKDTQEPRV